MKVNGVHFLFGLLGLPGFGPSCFSSLGRLQHLQPLPGCRASSVARVRSIALLLAGWLAIRLIGGIELEVIALCFGTALEGVRRCQASTVGSRLLQRRGRQEPLAFSRPGS